MPRIENVFPCITEEMLVSCKQEDYIHFKKLINQGEYFRDEMSSCWKLKGISRCAICGKENCDGFHNEHEKCKTHWKEIEEKRRKVFWDTYSRKGKKFLKNIKQ